MSLKTFTFKGEDNLDIFTYKWIPENKEIKCIVQISHGMAEHAKRYEKFAQFLNEKNIIVYANDHRGHGLTAGDLENVGFLSYKNGWQKSIKDMHTITNIAKNEYPNIPICIFGHSMGSFLTRNYLIDYSNEIDCAILSGTTGKPGFLENIGIIVVLMEILIHGKKGRSQLMWNMTFGKFNKSIKNPRTPFDWLSTDEEEVDKYHNDKYCGGVFTPQFFKDLLYGIKIINNKKLLNKIRKDIPIFLIAGDNDSVCNNGKGTIETYNTYKSLNMNNIKLKIYENKRHALIHEKDNYIIFNDIYEFIKSYCLK